MKEQQPKKFEWDEYGNLVLSTVEAVQTQVDGIKDTVKWAIGSLIVILIFVIGVLITDHRALVNRIQKVEDDIESLADDFGTYINLVSPDHKHLDNGSEAIIKKYFPPKRGKQEEGD